MADFVSPTVNEFDWGADLALGSDEPIAEGWRLCGTSVGGVPAAAGTAFAFDARANTDWYSANNAATCFLTTAATSEWLRAYNFDFASFIAASGPTIDGVEVLIDWSAVDADLSIHSLFLSWGASAATMSVTNKSGALPGTASRVVYGGPTDLWGETSIALTDLRTSDFGVSLRTIEDSGGSGWGSINSISMKIYWSDTADGEVRVTQQYVEVLGTSALANVVQESNRAIVVT